MNAAFLLLTTAWLAGADDAKPAAAAPAAPKPIAAAPIATSGCCGTAAPCGGCNDCCEKEGFFSKLKGKFHHDDCCCETKCAPTCAPTCAPKCAPTCNDCCEKEGFLSKLKGRLHQLHFKLNLSREQMVRPAVQSANT